jgi:rubrerythrin
MDAKLQILRKHAIHLDDTNEVYGQCVCIRDILPAMQEFAEEYHKEQMRNHNCMNNLVVKTIAAKEENDSKFWKLHSPLITPETWECPRCGVIHSYLKTSCDCPPDTRTSITYKQ